MTLQLTYAINKKYKKQIPVKDYKIEYKNQIVCPTCYQEVIYKKGRAKNKDGTIRISHFAHKPNNLCKSMRVDNENESESHRIGKNYIVKLFNEIFQNKKIVVDTARTEYYLKGRVADVFINFQYKGTEYKNVYEIQYSNITEEELDERHKFYQEKGINDLWIIGLKFDKNGFIRNDTLSLTDKISEFQKEIIFIYNDNLYIYNNKINLDLKEYKQQFIEYKYIFDKIIDINIENYFYYKFDNFFFEKKKVNKKALFKKISNKNTGTSFFTQDIPYILLDDYKKRIEKKLIINIQKEINKIIENIDTHIYQLFFNLLFKIDRLIEDKTDFFFSDFKVKNQLVFKKYNKGDKGFYSAIFEILESVKYIFTKNKYWGGYCGNRKLFDELYENIGNIIILYQEIEIVGKNITFSKEEFLDIYKSEYDGEFREFGLFYGLYMKSKKYIKGPNIYNKLGFIYKAVFNKKFLERMNRFKQEFKNNFLEKMDGEDEEISKILSGNFS